MSIDNVATYNQRAMNLDAKNAETSADGKVIDFDRMKAILYLGIRGEIRLPITEKHTIDTFA